MSRNTSWRSEASEGDQGEEIVKARLEAAGATVFQAHGNHPQYDLMARWPVPGDPGEWREITVEVKTQLRSEAYGSMVVETEVRGHLDGIRHPEKQATLWAFVVGRDGHTPERVLFMGAGELGEHVDWIEAERGLTALPRGSHPGRGVRVYFDDVETIFETGRAA
jgi:hypothetical protein